jgi:hypothetical protein
LLNHPIDDLVVGHRTLPAHAADQPDCLQGKPSIWFSCTVHDKATTREPSANPLQKENIGRFKFFLDTFCYENNSRLWRD